MLQVGIIRTTYHLRNSFNIANYNRTSTPAVIVRVSDGEHIGWGEAALPPYLLETPESVESFITKFQLQRFADDFSLSFILSELQNFSDNNSAAKAAIDIAIHDLRAKQLGVACSDLFGINAEHHLPTSYTLGIDSVENIRRITTEASNFKIIKVKLGGNHDRKTIQTIRTLTSKPLFVDLNQGWKSIEQAKQESEWLSSQGVILIEQPFPKLWLEESFRLKEVSDLPIIADESCQRIGDITQVANAFDGINIKLMKSAGMAEAQQMIGAARSQNLKILMGSMTESSVATMAANIFAPLVDFLDLDGPWLLANNPFQTPTINDGIIAKNSIPGLGAIPLIELKD
jgi:L-alanine-DL-glutamate epimerase-like enolase superfamily enzyme